MEVYGCLFLKFLLRDIFCFFSRAYELYELTSIRFHILFLRLHPWILSSRIRNFYSPHHSLREDAIIRSAAISLRPTFSKSRQNVIWAILLSWSIKSRQNSQNAFQAHPEPKNRRSAKWKQKNRVRMRSEEFYRLRVWIHVRTAKTHSRHVLRPNSALQVSSSDFIHFQFRFFRSACQFPDLPIMHSHFIKSPYGKIS